MSKGLFDLDAPDSWVLVWKVATNVLISNFVDSYQDEPSATTYVSL